MPSTWKMYGVDANKDGRKDPYNPVDAIFAAARYLKAAGYEQDVRRAIFAYNHADWYVDSVLLRARLIAGVPADLVGSLTGLTEGRFPVYARARYADDIAEQQLLKKREAGRERRPRRRVERLPPQHRHLRQQGAPVVAVNDGVIKKIGNEQEARPLHRAPGRLRQPLHLRAPRLGLEASTRCRRPTPRRRPTAALALSRPTSRTTRSRPRPRRPAASSTRPTRPRPRTAGGDVPAKTAAGRACRSSSACSRIPTWPGSREAGGLEQLLDSKARKQRHASRPSRPTSRARSASTLEGHASARSEGLARDRRHRPRPRRPDRRRARPPHLDFAIRPAGSGAPQIDPKPILDGWKLLEATAIYRASGRNVLYGGRRGRHVDRPDPAAAEAAARAARALRRAHRHLRGRPRRHPLRPDRPPRAGDARVPGRVRPAADRHLPEERPRLLHELGQRLRALAPATRSTSR